MIYRVFIERAHDDKVLHLKGGCAAVVVVVVIGWLALITSEMRGWY
jgi:hypothetical protein